MADIALAGCVIASHYAESAERQLAAPAILRAAASDSSDALSNLVAGERFELLDETLGWAWGYAGAERRVGYVRSEALQP